MSIGYDFFETEQLNKAYDILSAVTLLKTDCGKICGGKCCKGGDNDGMLLFPGEKALFENDSNFEIRYDSRCNGETVVCKGPCNRKNRPLSCRIFPYFPYVKDENGKLTVTAAPDIRALDVCDILSSGMSPDKNFLRAVRISGRILCGDEKIKSFLINITNKITDLGGFF